MSGMGAVVPYGAPRPMRDRAITVVIPARDEAHAIGGMAAFIPSRKDPQVNERAFQQVRAAIHAAANS